MDDEAQVERDELIERVAAGLREPVTLPADFDDRVMRAVRRPGPASYPARPLGWRMPAIGLALAAGVAAVAVLVPHERTPSDGSRAPAIVPVEVLPASRDAAKQAVQFVLVAPDARSVSVVGSFNDWDTAATRLRPAGGGVWSISVPLGAGRYTYSFLVDGKRWQPDPTAPRSVDDDFGTPSSVLIVPPGHPR